MDKKNKRIARYIGAGLTIILLFIAGFIHFKQTGEIDTNYIERAIGEIEKVTTYEISDEEIKNLPSADIVEQTEEEEALVSEEQATLEDEGFEEQGEIAFNGDSEFPQVQVGNYSGLTYYSQIDSRWSSHPYTSVGNPSQTIGSSGCGPTSAAMVVTSIKGTITPDTMGDYFVRYGYRSADNGTYYSAFRWVADTFNIGYEETYNLDRAIELLRNNNYVVCSVGNGLFTTGGHFIVLVGIDGNTIRVFDPYLYSGKFSVSTRIGKVTVNGNSAYVSVDNFRRYANALKFFAFKNNGSNSENNYKPVTTSTYTRYVKANGGLNVRNAPNGTRIGGLINGTKVTVLDTNGSWSHIISPVNGWVSSNYLYSNIANNTTTKKVVTGYRTGNYRVNASILNVRTGPSTGYRIKKYYELTSNARSQNKRLGNYYTNGLRRGVTTYVYEIKNGFGRTNSGYISLAYCTKL